ncbi:MAG: hypothetical protein AAGC95_07080 [Pseudomonadota bacterium]
MKRTILGVAAFIFSIAGAHGQALNAPSSSTDAFTPAYISSLLDELGITNAVQRFENEEVIIAAQAPNGLRFLMVFYACNPEDKNSCLGLNLRAGWRRAEGYAKGAVHDFGAMYPFAKSYVSGEGAVLSRYLTADYGVAKGNIAVNVGVFINFAQNFASYLSAVPAAEADRGVSASLTPDVSRRLLSAAGVEAGHEALIAANFADHVNDAPPAPSLKIENR